LFDNIIVIPMKYTEHLSTSKSRGQYIYAR